MYLSLCNPAWALFVISRPLPMLLPSAFAIVFVHASQNSHQLPAHRCPFWLFWLKSRWVALVYPVVFSHLPGISIYLQPKRTPMGLPLPKTWLKSRNSGRQGVRSSLRVKSKDQNQNRSDVKYMKFVPTASEVSSCSSPLRGFTSAQISPPSRQVFFSSFFSLFRRPRWSLLRY